MTIRDEAYHGKPLSVFIVDAHTHIGPYYLNGWYQAPSETAISAIINSMNRLGINCIVTTSHALVMGMMEVANEVVAKAIRDFPSRIYGYISICPGEGLEVVKSQIRQYGNHPGFLGFKFLPGYHGPLTQKEYEYTADYANEKSCIVLIHTWNENPPLSQLEELAVRHPFIKLLCAHQGGGSADLSRKLAAIMKRQPNLYMEICGSLLNTMAIEDLVALVGEDRIIYGSDMINLDPRYDFGRVVFSPLPDVIKKKLLSGNYLSLLNMSQMGQIVNY